MSKSNWIVKTDTAPYSKAVSKLSPNDLAKFVKTVEHIGDVAIIQTELLPDYSILITVHPSRYLTKFIKERR